MQKIFQNKNITQKIIIALVIVILFNFICPTRVEAKWYDGVLKGLGWIFVRIADAVQWIMLYSLTGDNTAVMWHATWAGEEDDEDHDNWEMEIIPASVLESAVSFGKKVINKISNTFTGKSVLKNSNNGSTLDDKETIEWPQRHLLTPADIFTGKVVITNVNFFKGYLQANTHGATSSVQSYNNNNGKSSADVITNAETQVALENLRKSISKWYSTIRNITIVGLLSVLVYIAIEMIISSASQDKAKYKKMLTDWLVAICLVFLLHYIMAITIGVCDRLTNLMDSQIKEEYYLDVDGEFEYDGTTYGSEGKGEKVNGLAEKIRICTQTTDATTAVSYSIMYFGITCYTVIFLWIYMKRFVYMAFFTLVAPIVALSYPIDKVKDGSSQAFDGWLKEYIYNALLQPFNLLIYTVFIGLAYDLAKSNIVYVFVVLATIPFADKQLGSWMGMDKAGTRKGISEGIKGVLAFKGLQSLYGGGKSSSSSSASSNSSSSSSSGGSGSSGVPSIRTKDNSFLNTQNGGTNQSQATSGAGSQSGNGTYTGTAPIGSQSGNGKYTGTASIGPQSGNGITQKPTKKKTNNGTNRQAAKSKYAKDGKKGSKLIGNHLGKKTGRALWNGAKTLTAGGLKFTGKAIGLTVGGVTTVLTGGSTSEIITAMGAGAAVGKNLGAGVADLPGNIKNTADKIAKSYYDNFGTKEKEQMDIINKDDDLKEFYGDKTNRYLAASVATNLGLNVKTNKREIMKILDQNKEFMDMNPNVDFDTSLETNMKAWDEASRYTREEANQNRIQYEAKSGEQGKIYADLIDSYKTPNITYADSHDGRMYHENRKVATSNEQKAKRDAWRRRNIGNNYGGNPYIINQQNNNSNP